MKRSIVTIFVAAILSLSSLSVRAGTIWEPASNTVQSIDFSHLFAGDTSTVFAIFDDTDAALSGPSLLLDAIPNGADTVTITDLGGGNIQFTAEGGSITYAGSAFRVGASFDGGSTWVADHGFELVSGFTYNVGFNEPAGPGALVADKVLTLIDVTPVPEPQTFLLMALGLAGLLALRRKA